ncbi:MAG TPA: RagB/SusD family nutrient uptake outer membrane protein [Cyclobacteriaceae bacterium]|nr:RagB/SusD family nutrient uptake outer membrane protein [Cyclobacteriaceae bacterium]
MRKIKLFIASVSLLILGSCNDYLESEPYTTITDVNFYKTPEDAYKALVGVYDGLQRMYSSWNGLVVLSEVCSDNTFGGGGNADGYGVQLLDEFDFSRSPSDNSIMFDNWRNGYRAIYRCNVLLSKLNGIEWGDDEATSPVYEAETRFIRALAYFDLVRFFGNVVFLTEPSTENLPQSEPDPVYALIAEDLQFAINNLPATSYSAQSPSDHGRVTKWAAEALMGRVFLFYTGYYQKPDLAGITKAQVLGYLEDVIANSGHELLPDFSSLWPAASLENYAGERNPENIFNIKYTYTSSYNGDVDGNHWLVMMGVRGGNYTPYGQGWGVGTVNPKLWDAYATTDTRKTASIISIQDEGIDFNKVDQREYTGYFNKKYTPMSDDAGQSLAVKLGGVDFQIGQYQDLIIMRYADVLLMAAELESPNAQEYFDAVRERAHGASFTSIPVSKANILEERRLEFAFEGIRYWDLLRQGVDVAAATIAESTILLNGGVETAKTISASNITGKKGLQQIPDSEITLSNGVLKQNEGW